MVLHMRARKLRASALAFGLAVMGTAAVAAPAAGAAGQPTVVALAADGTLHMGDSPGHAAQIFTFFQGDELNVYSMNGDPVAIYAGDCRQVSNRQVACPGVQRGRFNMGDGDDFVLATGPIPYTINGGAGADNLSAYYASSSTLNGEAGDDDLFGSDQGGAVGDQLTGGPGRDELQGNNGKDVFHTRDGEKDVIKCGSDNVKDDPSDRDSIDTRTNCP
jgi:hypothetical protein